MRSPGEGKLPLSPLPQVKLWSAFRMWGVESSSVTRPRLVRPHVWFPSIPLPRRGAGKVSSLALPSSSKYISSMAVQGNVFLNYYICGVPELVMLIAYFISPAKPSMSRNQHSWITT